VSEERDELELVHAVITRPPTAPLDLRPSLPPMLSAVVMKLLQKNADDRYQSARGVEQDLQRLYHQLSAQTRPRSPQISPLSSPPHPLPSPVFLLAAQSIASLVSSPSRSFVCTDS